MPLLHRKPFSPNPLPDDLNPNEEVFHCTLTNELFRNYDDFYERTILCNSLVWSCSITTKSNLTYQEAIDCEEHTKKKLLNFPTCLQKPILYLVGLCHRNRIDDLNDDIYSFVKERYFVGENVDFIHKNKRHFGQVMEAMPVNPQSLLPQNGGVKCEVDANDSSSSEEDLPLSSFAKSKPLEADEIKYRIKVLKNGDEEIITNSFIRRKQNVFTRTNCRLFLKVNTAKLQNSPTEQYVVEKKMVKKYGLNSMQWSDIFIGSQFSFASVSPKITRTKKVNGVAKKGEKIDDTRLQILKEKFKQKQAKEEERKMIKREKEEQKRKRAENNERARELAKLDKEKRQREREEDMLRLKTERENMRLQKLEEKRKLSEYLREWNRPRDDLECDDLKDLPIPNEIHTPIDPSLFGRVLSLLEFFNAFGELFDAVDEFPKGVNIEVLVEAIQSHDHDGPLCELVFFFLSNLFRTQAEEEEGSDEVHLRKGDKELAESVVENPNEETFQACATLTAMWPLKYQGCPLKKLELDSYTVSEILRLYCLTSCQKSRGADRLWRFQHRGGYNPNDDTMLRLCLERPELIEKLATTSVFDLEEEEKLCLLLCLSDHLLSFVTPRDYLDETFEKLHQAKSAYREDKYSESKRKKEAANERIKWSTEQQNLEKQARLKEIEDKLRRAERGLPEEVEEERVLRRRKSEERGEPRPLTAEEKKKKIQIMGEEENQAVEAWEFRQRKHCENIHKYQKVFHTMALGQDRYYRRYWNIDSIPGILVEEYVDEFLTDDLLTIQTNQKKPQLLSSISGRSTPGLSDNSGQNTPARQIKPGPQNLAPISIKSPLATTGLKHQKTNNAPLNNQTKIGCTDIVVECGDKIAGFNGASQPFISLVNINECVNESSRRTQGKKHRWYLYNTADGIENLALALNHRGFRESKLLSSLTLDKNRIIDNLSKPIVWSNSMKFKSEISSSPVVNFSDIICEDKLEKSLRDQILELESKIWSGTLGSTLKIKLTMTLLDKPKVENRLLWREAISTGYKYENEVLVDFSSIDKEGNDEEDPQSDDEFVCDPSVSFPLGSDTDVAMETNNYDVIKELAKCLLVVERSIDRKYLKSPLGFAADAKTRSQLSKEEVEEKDEKKSKKLLRRWEKSLLQCTSMSQIFLHLATLEGSVLWSKSVLNAKCRICRRKGDAEKMLLCDSCDRGHHMYCLRPLLKNVPAGNWYCPDCRPKQTKTLSPRKRIRTKSFSQDESSEESEVDEEEVDSEDAEQEDAESSEEEKPVKKNLKFKITQKHSKKKKTTAKNQKKVNTRKNALEENERIGSKRRSTGAWKDLTACQDILNDLIRHKDSWPFLEPVNKREVPDYYDIIKVPMDLSTIQRKLKNVQYESPTEFVVDVEQIFINCHLYNESKSLIAKTATNLQHHFDNKLNKLNLSHYRANKKRRCT